MAVEPPLPQGRLGGAGLPVGQGKGQPPHIGADGDVVQRAARGQIHEHRRRLGREHLRLELAAPFWIEARVGEAQQGVQPIGMHRREPHAAEVGVAGPMRHVRSPAQGERASAHERQREEETLKDQGRAAGGPHLQDVVPRPHRPRGEAQLRRADEGLLAGAGADGLGTAHARQVVGTQPRRLLVLAQVGEVERPAGDERQGQRGAEDLPSRLAFAPIQQHQPFSGPVGAGHDTPCDRQHVGVAA
ncbi:hypothetical protein STIAU_6581 [Stigmatella aurantiaca DW4/3-1]|uniref:Uncharacterized protein n=1 Tax=Stigmatella aurantiaca (strain DW4/3-1) TaxID=378806 RepID=Q08NA2_STIAD|nr:hypothetical protein STIAU_6581 [Stigmatella aurantiaca DW4/3-1]